MMDPYRASVVICSTILGLFFLFIIIGIRKMVHRKLYRPIRRHIPLRRVEYQDLYLHVRSGKYISRLNEVQDPENYINIWFFDEFDTRPVFLYFHGNSYNISYRKYMIDICAELRLNLLLVDYRGYGRSGGEADAGNVLEDARASYRFLRAMKYEPEEIIVWGESLGGSAACVVASLHKIRCSILLSTFASFHDLLVDRENTIRNYGFAFLQTITNDYQSCTNNSEMLAGCQNLAPVLAIHSRDDSLIDYSQAEHLIGVAQSKNKKSVLIPIRGDHDSPQIEAKDFLRILRFINTTGREKLFDLDRNGAIGPVVKRVVEIIKNISFTSRRSSAEATEGKSRNIPDS